MKKLTKQSLDELARTISVIPESNLNSVVGGYDPNDCFGRCIANVESYGTNHSADAAMSLASQSMNKNIFLFLCLCFIVFHISAKGELPQSQITIKFKNQSLDSALCQLERESGYSFVYQDTLKNKTAKINKKFKNKTIVQILNVLLANTKNNYATVGNWWVIIYKKDDIQSNTNNKTDTSTLKTGKVVDEKGERVIGASIFLKGEDSGTVTDYEGNFNLPKANSDAELIVRYIGYLPRVVKIRDAKLIKIVPNPELDKKVFIIR